jgi:hypothetical protein
MFSSIALFAARAVYRAALDRECSGAFAETVRLAEETATLLDELARTARCAPLGVLLSLAPFGASDTDSAPMAAAVAAASLRERLVELRSIRPGTGRALLHLQHSA